ncbi:MAG: GNAT family N-acetyltransferase [Myxococcales bacterium]|nr:GNAT family N-acetyltransferase [Myxococcales bacterium]|tara:strand:- start:229 stop:684 length:456 start_codon:yes stop_codon:yes gene_type:complete
MDSTVQLQWITRQHPFYPAELALRYIVLRAPLKMPRGSEVYAFEEETWHCVAHINNEVVGCVLLHPQNTNKSGKLLQMAVHPDHQGRGIGAQLVRGLEAHALNNNITSIVMNAREVAFPFYEKLGYVFASDFFEEVGIPHRTMTKQLRHDP